jgi:hypothetical protein
MTLRDVLSAVLGEAGFLVPTSFVGSTSPDDVQMVYLANRASAFVLEKGFQKLHKRTNITLTTATEYDLPADFLELVPDTARVNGRIDTLNLPTSAPMWAYLQASTAASNYIVKARLLDNKLAIFSPSPGDVVSFEYVSQYPILGADGITYQQRFLADLDSWLLDDDLLILETRWRFERAKGLGDWQVTQLESQKYANSVMGRDSGSQSIIAQEPGCFPEPYTNLWVPS